MKKKKQNKDKKAQKSHLVKFQKSVLLSIKRMKAHTASLVTAGQKRHLRQNKGGALTSTKNVLNILTALLPRSGVQQEHGF